MAAWIGAVPGQDAVPDAHLVAAVDRALAGTSLHAPRIHTHVDREGAVAVTAVSVLLDGEPTPAVLQRLRAELGGPVTGTPEGTGSGAAGRAAAAAAAGTGGRCVRYPGQEHAEGDRTVAELLSGTALDAVVGVGRAVRDEDVVATAGFVRPHLLDGRLELLVEPAAGGVLRPVEVQSPHQCCGGEH